MFMKFGIIPLNGIIFSVIVCRKGILNGKNSFKSVLVIRITVAVLSQIIILSDRDHGSYISISFANFDRFLRNILCIIIPMESQFPIIIGLIRDHVVV